MADEILGNPQEANEHDETPKGVGLFMKSEDIAFLTNVGREISERWLQESFILYRIDLSKTQFDDLYGESILKSYKDPIEIFGRLNIDNQDPSFQTSGGIVKRNAGTMTAHVYLTHLEELGLLERREGQYVHLDLSIGDYIYFKGQYFEIKDDGFSQLGNKYAYGGDRRFYISIRAIEVDEDRFRGR
jgi:hypothetical protein